MLGPHISVSIRPTVAAGLDAKAWASMVENVDLPTPPLPERTRILCRILDRRAVMRGTSGSGPLGVVAQIDWLGQPAQEEAWPAWVDSGPGQCSGSGATSFGIVLGGEERSICVGSSREGAMVGWYG